MPHVRHRRFTVAAGMGSVLTGCFRNRTAVAERASASGTSIAVIAAGERWQDGSLRSAFEDLCAAGAIISKLAGTRSPEASLACTALAAVEARFEPALFDCASGRELVEKGLSGDVSLAAMLDASPFAPKLISGAFTRSKSSRDTLGAA